MNEKLFLMKKRCFFNRKEERMKKYGNLLVVIVKLLKKNFIVDNVVLDIFLLREKKCFCIDLICVSS